MHPARLPFAALLAILALAPASMMPAHGQENAREEAARRAAALKSLPEDAAKRFFGTQTSAAPLAARAIGFYSRGCLAGARALPVDGETWQVMRTSRNRNWGHPALIAFLERLSARVPEINGWPGLLVGDISQPRGGPMLTGHASHQVGLDADIWLTPMPSRRLSLAERDEIAATNVVAGDWNDVDPTAWTKAHTALIRAVAKEPAVERVFVNPAIKKALCREAGRDRAWLATVRPTYGHNYHFHIRLACPRGEDECRPQAPPPKDDGCGKELAWWFSDEARNPKPTRPAPPLTLEDLPAACRSVLAAQ
ncbi:Murein endopeptidase [Chelatococcus sambhunathii]|uniref:Penicillin-insensitive murein endopeptidase n=2 Tax=Chelatococcus TaxID=28209 RepID=A0AAC9JQJ8_9HYPH|nr:MULTISPECIES: penicillin-insensitive murein endopeptidase [Chelatococcus]APF38367.1 penicillin-insensitive murein endopeptidase [Chelatococcus daeguensis]CUA84883.1 Murein endopeptidase [Chelatococcus sambhunathii]